MQSRTILTCAVTGGDDNAGRYSQLPVTPRQIAESSIEAAKAGAAIVHLHVRDPATGKPSMELALYREVVERIRSSETDVVINLTTGPGARFVPDITAVNAAAPGSNVRPAAERVRHIIELQPEICSLDMGTLNFGAGALINTPAQIKVIAAGIRQANVKAELEIFDTGHLALARQMIADGLVDEDAFFQIALGIPWGAPATPQSMMLMSHALPHGANWAAFGVGRSEFSMVAQAVLLGGHVRVGMEDNFFLDRGVQAKTNAQLVEKAAAIVHSLGGTLASPAEARAIIGIGKN
ncbi:3-keto-5-aminohexanoate cleavage protein [Bradyrhizobium sp. NP1]|uniref:3-keto-5-aminohexanoate cleavage protein n=1 Tax=Bradyrhizobium sp. NP1 TaxID=3049772 RepID=UPI0025A63A34|nr:3-keto-5-aminohexanoate cleavage protein [Bradyrhizobium sp. NP1]WJR80934.1 3-keto-5-aminohexanoate cleavage protein [Bradyrhizobium sp. NP1]